jgi:two-component system response regulator YesN
MVKLIVVDDDEIIRNGIANDPEWEKYNIQVVGSAKNGLEGIELIREHTPEIVLSDIKMPFMDGLEMIEAAREWLPHLKVVFLTAYEDFHYAKRGLRLKATEYILKYADKRDIVAAVLKAKDEWTEERKLRDRVEKNNHLLINQFLGDLLSTVVSEQHAVEQVHTLGLDLQEESFCVAVIGIQDYGPFSIAKKQSDLELALRSIMNISNEILFIHGKGLAFSGFNHHINIIFNYKEHPDANEIMYKILEEIADNTCKYLKILVNIGVGNAYSGFAKIKLSYNEAVQALGMRDLIGKQRIIPIDSIKFNENSQASLFKRIIKYVDAGYTRNVSLSDITAEVHISMPYICTLFRKYKNCTLSEYIIGIRIDKAKELFEHTDMKTYEVSEKVGYTNPQYFSMLFKKWTGMTPTEYKQAHM